MLFIARMKRKPTPEIQKLIVEEVKKVLFEIYDTEIDLFWKPIVGGMKAVFQGPEGKEYSIETVSFDDLKHGPFRKRMVRAAQEAFPNDDVDFRREFFESDNLIVEASFALLNPYGKNTGKTYEITNEVGFEAAKIFGIVINGLAAQVTQENIKGFMFSSEEPSRKSLYSRLGPSLARKIGFVYGTDNDKYHHFILHKDILNKGHLEQ